MLVFTSRREYITLYEQNCLNDIEGFE